LPFVAIVAGLNKPWIPGARRTGCRAAAEAGTFKAMAFESDKIMFEIYRETEYTGKYRVVYFTELQDHNKESEINHAMAGEHFYDGFLRNYRKDEAKQIIEGILERLNGGEKLDARAVESALGEHIAAD
jgi:hypothetical protein